MTRRVLSLAVCAAAIWLAREQPHASARPATRAASMSPPPIVSISVCSAHDHGAGAGSCDHGFDTHQEVLAPIGTTCQNPDANKRCSINDYGGLAATSDQKQTIFAPGTLGQNKDYLFWVAAGTRASVQPGARNGAIGAVVLSGGPGAPDPVTGVGLDASTGQWTLDFTRTRPLNERYGFYGSQGFGPVFLPVAGGASCPGVTSSTAQQQDQTFDLSYGAPGTVVKDGNSGRLLMLYFAGNHCAGLAGGSPSNNGYMATGVATSLDEGRHWPTYASPFVPLPSESDSWPGPNAPFGALGDQVFVGNRSHSTRPRPADYGRYPVLTPQISLVCAITGTQCPTGYAGGTPLGGDYGDGEPSAFVDDVQPGPWPFLYVVHGYNPGRLDRTSPGPDLMIARAALPGSGTVTFTKWHVPPGLTGSFDVQPGMGGAESPIFPSGPFDRCEAKDQNRHMGSINYVDAAQQYLLTFVCDSPIEPKPGTLDPAQKRPTGSSWFFSTSDDLSDPTRWSAPQEIAGSWGTYDTCGSGPSGDYKGWYPTLMSLGGQPGHLSTRGYVFYLWGCQGNGAAGGRHYSSRAFRITTTDTTPPRTTVDVSGRMGLNGWYRRPVTLAFSATDDASGVATTESSLDNGVSWKIGTARTLNADGVYAVLFRSIDVDGNVESPQSIGLTIDATAPVTTASTHYISVPGVGPVSLSVDLTATDNLSGIATTEYSLDGQPWTTGIHLGLAASGTYTIRFRSIDVAGNQESTKSLTVVVHVMSQG
jgi:hypothetical protein